MTDQWAHEEQPVRAYYDYGVTGYDEVTCWDELPVRDALQGPLVSVLGCAYGSRIGVGTGCSPRW